MFNKPLRFIFPFAFLILTGEAYFIHSFVCLGVSSFVCSFKKNKKKSSPVTATVLQIFIYNGGFIVKFLILNVISPYFHIPSS